MGFYLRKAIKIGPIRLNLSKSGVGVSAGVKGLRYGIRGDGRAYIHGGRYGLYYRQELGGRKQQPNGKPVAASSAPTEVYDTLSAAAIGKLSRTNLVELLKDSYTQFRFDYLVFSVAALGSALAFSVNQFVGGFILLVSIGAVVMTALWETKRRTIYVHYDMREPVLGTFRKVVDSFNELAACQQVWALTSSTRLDTLTDFKRHAGASSLVERSVVRVGEGTPPWVETNIQVPTIHSRGQTLYFLPDGILAYDHSGVGFIDYVNLRVSAETTNFVEQSAPSDAEIISYTWQHPNKDGGPDRRFANNRQLPVCLYGNAALYSPHGLILLIQTSRHVAPAKLENGLLNVAAAIQKVAAPQLFRPAIDVNAERFQSLGIALRSVFKAIAVKTIGIVPVIDFGLKKMVGEENNILHQFMRVLAIGLFVGLFVLSAFLLRSMIG